MEDRGRTNGSLSLKSRRLFDCFVSLDFLLDYEVSGVALDDVFDIRKLVSRQKSESVRVLSNSLVFGDRELHDGHAVRIRALTDEVVLAVPFISELDDALVDVPEQHLILGEAFFAASHA
jgi:hypothetical protein